MIDEINAISLTPCFISGADDTYIKYDLLRPPSLKGILRWWFRAIARPLLDLKDLHFIESVLFGSTENISPFKMRIVPLNSLKIKKIETSNFKFNYLWHPLFLNKEEYLQKNYIEEGSKFKILLLFNDKFLSKSNKENFKLLRILWYHCLWLLFNLGGIGLKSRRGAGSFIVDTFKSEDNKDLPEFKFNPQEKIIDFYKKEFDKVKQDLNDLINLLGLSINPSNFLNQSKSLDLNEIHSFTIFPFNTNLILVGKFNKWELAIRKLQDLWRNFRSLIKRDDKSLLGYLGGPITTDKYGSYFIPNRLSSPFYFSIKRLDGYHYITNLLSNSSFHEYNFNIKEELRTIRKKGKLITLYGNKIRDTIKINENSLPTLIEKWISLLQDNFPENNLINVNF